MAEIPREMEQGQGSGIGLEEGRGHVWRRRVNKTSATKIRTSIVPLNSGTTRNARGMLSKCATSKSPHFNTGWTSTVVQGAVYSSRSSATGRDLPLPQQSHLKRGCLKDGPGQMCFGVVGRQAAHQAPRVAAPVRCQQSSKRWDKKHSAVIRHASC